MKRTISICCSALIALCLACGSRERPSARAAGDERPRGAAPGAPVISATPCDPGAISGDEARASLVLQQSHTGMLTATELSRDGRILVTTGMDGTIRVWDTTQGLLLRTFAVGAGQMGVSLSASGNMLAFTGYATGAIARGTSVVDLATGKERGHIPMYGGASALSPDGALFASGAGSIVTVFDTRTAGPTMRIAPSGGKPASMGVVNALAFDADGKRLVIVRTVGTVGTPATGEIAVYAMPSGALISSRPFPPAPTVRGVAIAGERIATRGTGIDVLGPEGIAHFPGVFTSIAVVGTRLFAADATAQLVAWDLASSKPVALGGGLPRASQLAASADGSTLVLATTNWASGPVLEVVDVASMQTVRTIEGRLSLVRALAFTPDGKTLAAGSGLSSIARWAMDGGSLLDLRSAEILGNTVALDYDATGAHMATATNTGVRIVETATGRVERQWKAMGPAASFGIVVFMKWTPGGDMVTVTGDGVLKVWSASAAMPPPTQEHVTALEEIAKPASRDLAKMSFNVRTVALSPAGDTLVVQGIDLAHQAVQHVVAVSVKSGAVLWDQQIAVGLGGFLAFAPDGRVLLSGSLGSVAGSPIRAFDPATGNLVATVKLSTSGPIAVRPEGVIVGGDHPVLLDPRTLAVRGSIAIDDLSTDAVTAAPQSKIFALGGASGAIAIVSSETGRTLASLLATSNGEYVSFTPEGAYRSSVDGARSVAWTFTEPLEGFSFDQFAARFDKPDLIAQRLRGEAAPAPAALTRPPRLCVSSSGEPLRTEATHAKVASAIASHGELARVRAFVNGRLGAEQPLSGARAEAELDVPLASGHNRVTLIAYDKDGLASNPKTVDIVSTAPAKKPDLWLVTVGVSRYPNLGPDLQLEVADDDAREIAARWAAQAGPSGPFAASHVTTLVDADVTVENVERAVQKLSEMKSDDLAVVFMAGHGVRLKDGTMVFLTSQSSTTSESARANGVGWGRLRGILGKAKGRVLLLLDACHSGHVSTESVVHNEALAEALAGEDRVGVLVFAASRGAQLSYEVGPATGSSRGLELAWVGAAPPKESEPPKVASRDKGHGLFTSAVLEALAGRAPDRDGSGAVEIGEFVDYVTERVRAESNGKQTPWVARREMFGDFVVAPATW